MRRLLPPLLVLATGCPTEVDPPPPEETGEPRDTAPSENDEEVCDAAARRVEECGLTPAETPYSTYLADECAWACEAACIARAACQELDAANVVYYDEEGCMIYEGTTGRCVTNCETCITPLVVSFDGGVVPLEGRGGRFDFGDGPVATAWPGASVAWLTLDRDANGRIDDGTELFGSATPLRSGARATNGFAPLAELDTNRDGRISALDPAWAALRLWYDLDGDHASSPDELFTADAQGLVSLDLAYTVAPRCDALGNCERERARVLHRDAPDGPVREGAVIDLHLRTVPDVLGASD